MSSGKISEPIRVPVAADGRVDLLVLRAIAGWSRRRVHDLFDVGAVRINGRRARKGDQVRAGDIVAIDLSSLAATLVPAPQLPVRILHTDDQIVVIDKPAGMPSVARRASDTNTVANFLIARFPELADASPNPLEAGLVHRLDSATSGVLLAARTRAAHARLRSIFMRAAVKDYAAVVQGIRPSQDRIALPIAHMPRRPRRMCACRDAADARALAARRAETIYRTIQTDADSACLAVRIRTGVRHQIRVHLAAQGRAIVGDDLYDRRADTVTSPRARLLLHAYRLRLRDPEHAIAIDCIAELPEDFAAVLTARSWRLPRPSDWDDL